MKKTKYIAGIITILGATWLHAQINVGPNNGTNGTYSSVAGGDYNKTTSASAYAIVAGGARNTNSVLYGSIGGGKFNEARAEASTIPGGVKAKTRSYGQMAYGSGSFSGEAGEAQFGLYVLRGTTVGAVTEPLALDGDLDTEHIIVTTNASYLFDIDIVARANDKANGWYGNFFHYRVAVENQNGDLICTNLDVSSLTLHNPNVVASLDAVASGNLFKVYGTGESGQTIHWVATVRATELRKPD
jgi:hypothetical protein